MYIQIWEREAKKWFLLKSRPFYNPRQIPTDHEYVLSRYGLTTNIVITEFIFLTGGKPGFYIADLRDKKYFYCGNDKANVTTWLKDLGIGRDEPNYPQIE